MIHKLLIVCLCLLLASNAVAQDLTYRYAHHDGHDLYLDLYRPTHQRPDQACVVYLFGGGFLMGSRNEEASRKVCQTLADRGFVVAAIDYRLGLKDARLDTVPLLRIYHLFEHAIDIAVEDCSAAVAFLYERADELSISRSHICLMGSSAGAVTVLQTDYARANALPVASALPEGFRPLVVAPYAGAVHTHNRQMRYLTPPSATCFFHGTDDRLVHYRRFRSSFSTSLFGANSLAKIFKRGGYTYQIVRFDNRGHDVAGYMVPTVADFCAFVDNISAGRAMQCDSRCSDPSLPEEPWGKATVFGIYMKP